MGESFQRGLKMENEITKYVEYWFIPTITSFDNRIEFRGSIRYIGPDGEKQGFFKKVINSIGEFLFFIFILPIVVVIRVYMFLEWLVRKMLNHPKPKGKTDEERLFDLMENYFGCISK